MLNKDVKYEVAVVTAARTLRRRVKRPVSKDDYEAFLSSAGSWKGIVDADKLLADIEESRSLPPRPAIEL